MTTRAQRSAKSQKLEALIDEDRELLKALVKEAVQEVLEAEMTDALGARAGERTTDRTGYRSGYYSRGLVTRIGKLDCGSRGTGRAASRPSCLSATSARRRPW